MLEILDILDADHGRAGAEHWATLTTERSEACFWTAARKDFMKHEAEYVKTRARREHLESDGSPIDANDSADELSGLVSLTNG